MKFYRLLNLSIPNVDEQLAESWLLSPIGFQSVAKLDLKDMSRSTMKCQDISSGRLIAKPAD